MAAAKPENLRKAQMKTVHTGSSNSVDQFLVKYSRVPASKSTTLHARRLVVETGIRPSND
jgi:hypothetical protein